jgi:hypothetical protein
MRKMTLFKVFIVLLLCFVAFGFYRGWFILSSQGGSDNGGKVGINLSVDPDKAKQDAEAVESKARELTGSSAENTPPNPTEDDSTLDNN